MTRKNHLMIDRSMLLRAKELRAAADKYYTDVGDNVVEEKLFSYYAAATAIEDGVKKRIRARKLALESARDRRERARRKKLGLWVPSRERTLQSRKRWPRRVVSKSRLSPREVARRFRKMHGPSSAQPRLSNGERVRRDFIKVFGLKKLRELCKNPKWARNIHDNMCIMLSNVPRGARRR